MRGNDYVEVHKSICINIVDSLCIYESEKKHNIFKVLEVNEHFLLDDDLEIHYFQLPKIHDIIVTDEGYKSWMFLIKNLGDQEQDEMINELVEREDVFKMAYEEYSKISADDLVRERIEAHEKYLMDQRTRERIAHEEGMERGIEQGVNKTKIEMAQKALEKGLSIEDIADLTGLSVEEIEQIGHAHT
jgi:predicted transposase/invertase (TIGR01784 family)